MKQLNHLNKHNQNNMTIYHIDEIKQKVQYLNNIVLIGNDEWCDYVILLIRIFESYFDYADDEFKFAVCEEITSLYDYAQEHVKIVTEQEKLVREYQYLEWN